jgi:hypothetical protein
MVDKQKILALYQDYFDTDQDQIKAGSVSVDDNGLVSVNDSVWILKYIDKLPIGFDRVLGNFDGKDNSLESLDNFPKYVKNDLDVSGNSLKNLVGAPSYVGGQLWITRNPLVSLEGFPRFVGGQVRLTYRQNLPLLRTLVAPEIVVYGKPRVMVILNKYAGQGKMAVFDCQKDLEDAGFPGNAHW